MNKTHVTYLLAGGGLAAASAAEAIRARDPNGSIMLVGQEINRPYHRPPLSKKYLRREITRSELIVEPIRMFDRNSRYSAVKTEMLVRMGPDGQPREIAHAGRRLLPPAEAGTTLVEHVVSEGDRIDSLASRYLGDPTEFWRVLDANRALSADELLAFDANPRTIRVALPEA